MYVNIKYLENLKFNNCRNCTKCCENKMFAPLILEDIKKVYKFFPIFIIFIPHPKLVIPLSLKNHCPYLKYSKCTIYESRPPACKIYPFSPWYGEIILDLSCDGIGIKGKNLPLNINEFKNSQFYDERIENIEEKLEKTDNWIKNQKLTYLTKKNNIKIYKIKHQNDKYNNLIQLSYQNLKIFNL
jgi:Fe-S-cluster containining protein